MSSSNSNITNSTQNSPTCDAWGVLSFRNELGTVVPYFELNQSAGLFNTTRTSVGISKIGYRVEFTEPERFSSGVYVPVVTPQILSNDPMYVWTVVENGFTCANWSGSALDSYKSGFAIAGVTQNFKRVSATSLPEILGQFNTAIIEARPDYKANIAVFSMSGDSTRNSVTAGVYSLAKEGAYGKITDSPTSTVQNIGLFDGQKRVASAYGTINVVPKRNASKITAYMEDSYNAYGITSGFVNGVSAGGVYGVDVRFTEPLDNADYCVILSRESSADDMVPTNTHWSYRIPYIRGEKTRNGFRVEVAGHFNNSSTSVYTGITSAFYSLGYGEKIHFMVFGGTDERAVSTTSTNRAWTTNPRPEQLSVPNGPADYEVYGVCWTDPDYGKNGGGGIVPSFYNSSILWDQNVNKYSGFYAPGGGITYTVPADYVRRILSAPSDDPISAAISNPTDWSSTSTVNSLNAVQSGLKSLVPLIVPYQSASNNSVPPNTPDIWGLDNGAGSINNSMDQRYGISFASNQLVWRTIDRLKNVPAGKRHLYPRFIGGYSPAPIAHFTPYDVLQYRKLYDGFTWSGGNPNGVTSSGYRVPSGSKVDPQYEARSRADGGNPYIWGITSHSGLSISEDYPSGVTGITLYGAFTLYHCDRLWFGSNSVLVAPPTYRRDGLGVWTAGVGEAKRVAVESVGFSGTVNTSNNTCDVEQSVLVSGGTFMPNRLVFTPFCDAETVFAGDALGNYLQRVESGQISDRPVGQNYFNMDGGFNYIDDDVESTTPYSLYYNGQNSGLTNGDYWWRTNTNGLAYNSRIPNTKSVFFYDDLGVSAGKTAFVNYKDPEMFMAMLNDPRIYTYKLSTNGITTENSDTVSSLFMKVYRDLLSAQTPAGIPIGTFYRGMLNPPAQYAAITLSSIGGATTWSYNAYNVANSISSFAAPERRKYPLASINYMGGTTTGFYPDDSDGLVYGVRTRINGADRGAFTPYNIARDHISMCWGYCLRMLDEMHYRALVWNRAKRYGLPSGSPPRNITCGNYMQQGPVNVNEMLFARGAWLEPNICPAPSTDITCSPNFYGGVGVTSFSGYIGWAASYFPNPQNADQRYLVSGVPGTMGGSRRVLNRFQNTSADTTRGIAIGEVLDSANYGGDINAYQYTPLDGSCRFYPRTGLKHGSNPDHFGGIRSDSWFGITASSPQFVTGMTVAAAFRASDTGITVWSTPTSGVTMLPGDYIRFGAYGCTVYNFLTGGAGGAAGGKKWIQFHSQIGFTGATGDTLLHERSYSNAGFLAFIMEMQRLRAYQRTDPELWKHFAPWVSSPRLAGGGWAFKCDPRYWFELMYHLMVAGSQRLIQWCDNVEWEVGDRDDNDLIYIHTALNNWRNISGNSRCAEPADTGYHDLSGKIFRSGARIQKGPNAGLYIWRLTVIPGPVDETVTLEQSTRPDLPPTITIPGGVGPAYPFGVRGAWLITESSIPPEYTIRSPAADWAIRKDTDQYYVNIAPSVADSNDTNGVTWGNWTTAFISYFQGTPSSSSIQRAFPWEANPANASVSSPWHNAIYESVEPYYNWGARSFHFHFPWGTYGQESANNVGGASAGVFFLTYQQWKDGYTTDPGPGLTHQSPARWKGFPEAVKSLLEGNMIPRSGNGQPQTGSGARRPITEPCNVCLYVTPNRGYYDYRRKSNTYWKSLAGTTAEKDATYYSKLDSMVEMFKSMKPSNPQTGGKLTICMDVGSATPTPESVHMLRTVTGLSGEYITDALELSDWYVWKKLEAAGIQVFLEARPPNRRRQYSFASGMSGAAGLTVSSGLQGSNFVSSMAYFWTSNALTSTALPTAVSQFGARDEFVNNSDPKKIHLYSIQTSYMTGSGIYNDPYNVWHYTRYGATAFDHWYGSNADRSNYAPYTATFFLYGLSDHRRHYKNLYYGNTAEKGVRLKNYNSIVFDPTLFAGATVRTPVNDLFFTGSFNVPLSYHRYTWYETFPDPTVPGPRPYPPWNSPNHRFTGATLAAFLAGPTAFHDTGSANGQYFWTEDGTRFWRNNIMKGSFSEFVKMLDAVSATAAPQSAVAEGWAGATYPYDYYTRNIIGAVHGLSKGGSNEFNNSTT